MDLMDRSKIEAAAHVAGYEFIVLQNPAAIVAAIADRPPVIVFVDLTHRSADEAIRQFGDSGVRTVAYRRHLDADVALMQTGAWARSMRFRDLASFVTSAAGSRRLFDGRLANDEALVRP